MVLLLSLLIIRLKRKYFVLKHGEPLIFGPKEEKGIILDGFQVQIVNFADGSYTKDDLWIHDEKDHTNILTNFLMILLKIKHYQDLWSFLSRR